MTSGSVDKYVNSELPHEEPGTAVWWFQGGTRQAYCTGGSEEVKYAANVGLQEDTYLNAGFLSGLLTILSPYSLCIEDTHIRNMACWVLSGCAVMVSVRNGVPGKARVRYEAKALLGLGLSLCLWVLFTCFVPPPHPKAKHLSSPKTNTPYLLNSQCISSLVLSILVSGALKPRSQALAPTHCLSRLGTAIWSPKLQNAPGHSVLFCF